MRPSAISFISTSSPLQAGTPWRAPREEQHCLARVSNLQGPRGCTASLGREGGQIEAHEPWSSAGSLGVWGLLHPPGCEGAVRKRGIKNPQPEG